jgi:acylphosphatase
MGAESLARRFQVSGRVQGVGYRYFAERAALRLGVAGYVKNLPDGCVEVYALGSAAQVDAFRDALRRGPIPARVDRVEESEAEPLEKYAGGFTIETEY